MRPLVLLAALAATAVTLLPLPAAGGSTAAATLTVRDSNWGRIVFDSRGRALYAFTRDGLRRTTCFGACAAAWPPYIVSGKLRPGRGTRARLLGTIRRPDGTRQLTYAGRALYYYVGDTGPGVVRCQNVFGFGGLWLVQRPNGTLVR